MSVGNSFILQVKTNEDVVCVTGNSDTPAAACH